MLEWGAILQKGAEALTVQLIKVATEKVGKSFDGKLGSLALDFQPHLAFAYNRCTKVKTLLNRDAPVDLLQQYVTLKHRIRDKVIDDFDLIDEIWSSKHIIISSTGGGGKSMFMRYFWISCVANPRGKIPIYVELRRLNEIENPDLETFLFHTAVSSTQSGARSQFSAALRGGLLLLILDGFDEINQEIRSKVEAQLLDLANTYPESIIVVSGRPDDRYDSWQSFSKYVVQPLDKTQTVALVERLDFNEDTKSKFLKKLKKGEFDHHRSFLCRPLLATMMLLMFDYYADVPSKVHLFYEQAFDALFYIHDSLKESFQRKRHTDYPIDVFKRYMGYFCLTTYNDQVLSFTNSDLLDYVKQAGKLDGTAIDAENFIRDLKESVCILQEDGLNQVFTHRSFQEYFSAYSLSKFDARKAGTLLRRFSVRYGDTVVQMTYDINRPLVEDALLLPLVKECETKCKPFSAKRFSAKDCLSAIDGTFVLSVEFSHAQSDQPTSFSWYIESSEDFYSCRKIVTSLILNRPVTDSHETFHRSGGLFELIRRNVSGQTRVVLELSATEGKIWATTGHHTFEKKHPEVH